MPDRSTTDPEVAASDRRILHPRDERGAALILAIAFLLVIGGIGAAVVSSVTSGLKDRVVLDQVRNREYAADAGVQFAITQVRGLASPGAALAPCSSDNSHYTNTLNNVHIWIDCSNQPTVTLSGFLQRNVVFTACVDPGFPDNGSPKCTDLNTVIRAQINFQSISSGPTVTISRTFVQSWSVNG